MDPGLTACEVLNSIAFELLPTFVDPEAAEISDALSPAITKFIEDSRSVIDPMAEGEGMMVAPVKDDAGLLTFGLAIESEGKVYLPVDGNGQGWLLEVSAIGDGWHVEAIASWIA